MMTHLPAKADVVQDVFERSSTWTDHEVVRWRHGKLRCRLIQEYGGVVGQNYVSEGRNTPSENESLPVPYPRGLDGEEERKAFRTGFFLGAIVSGASTRPGFTREIRDFEKRLGLT
ncbi:MAG TPA: hypothetical protein VM222_07910 [Planctomycetota bacterium]|nr:hypothetical protein [Planctomycetota bacterium]